MCGQENENQQLNENPLKQRRLSVFVHGPQKSLSETLRCISAIATAC